MDQKSRCAECVCKDCKQDCGVLCPDIQDGEVCESLERCVN
jgi:hypothetical protein